MKSADATNIPPENDDSNAWNARIWIGRSDSYTLTSWYSPGPGTATTRELPVGMPATATRDPPKRPGSNGWNCVRIDSSWL